MQRKNPKIFIRCGLIILLLLIAGHAHADGWAGDHEHDCPLCLSLGVGFPGIPSQWIEPVFRDLNCPVPVDAGMRGRFREPIRLGRAPPLLTEAVLRII